MIITILLITSWFLAMLAIWSESHRATLVVQLDRARKERERFRRGLSEIAQLEENTLSPMINMGMATVIANRTLDVQHWEYCASSGAFDCSNTEPTGFCGGSSASHCEQCHKWNVEHA